MAGKEVSEILSSIKVLNPFLRILHNVVSLSDGPYHLLLANKQMSPMVVKEVHRRPRPLSVGHKHIRRHAIPPAEAQLYLTCLVADSLFLGQNPHVPSVWSRRLRSHALEDFGPCLAAPVIETDAPPYCRPCHRIA